jgi:hypothetical protein
MFGAADAPYMLVQFIPGRVSLDAVEKDLAQLTKKPIDMSKQVKAEFRANAGVQSATLDRSRNMITVEFTMSSSPTEKMRGITYGFIGKNGIANLHCYAPASTFTRELPTFQGFANSFAYDTGYEYKPGGARTVGRGAGIGVAVLAIAWVIRKMRSAAA